jgi:aryl-alcohol dehydrogenase-like predicted oxidoreductase
MTLRPEPYEEIAREPTFDGLEAFERAARERGTDAATLALAWVLDNPLVTAVIVGPRRPEHLEPARAALEVGLSAAERDELGALFA